MSFHFHFKTINLSVLQVVVDFLIEIEMMSDAQTLFEARDSQMKMTPLHIAVMNPNPLATR